MKLVSVSGHACQLGFLWSNSRSCMSGNVPPVPDYS